MLAGLLAGHIINRYALPFDFLLPYAFLTDSESSTTPPRGREWRRLHRDEIVLRVHLDDGRDSER